MSGEGADPETPQGALRPTPLVNLLGWALVGVVGGWAVHPVFDRLGFAQPVVAVHQALALVLLAAILGYVAWATHRAVHVRRERLEVHQAVNRLILARACALVGALVAGGYVGYAISWIGDPSALAGERLLRSLIAGGCALAATIAALLLERACRVRKDDPGTP